MFNQLKKCNFYVKINTMNNNNKINTIPCCELFKIMVLIMDTALVTKHALK